MTHQTILSDNSLSPKTKYRSPLRYPGGKQKAIGEIAKWLPQSAYEYREAFVGGGSVYFHARTITLAKKYWINDVFKDLTLFWQIVQNPITCKKLINDLESLRSGFSSPSQIKKFYERAKRELTENPYRKALLFFFFNRVSFSGTTNAGGFSKLASMHRFTASSIQRLAGLPEALSETTITNWDFEQVISSPGKDVFLFLDPPYYTAKKLYGPKGALHSFDHERLANILKKTEHKFLITYDNCPEIQKLYKWAKRTSWQLRYGMNNCNTLKESKIGAELFISNY